MKTCCIEICRSRAGDIERSFFEINDRRKEWINIIKTNQTLNTNLQLYVCDRHFSPIDMQKCATKCVLRKGAVPRFSLQESNDERCAESLTSETESLSSFRSESTDEFYAGSNTSETVSSNLLQNLSLYLDDDESPIQQVDPQFKTVLLEEYEKLVLLIPEVERLKNVIRTMGNTIRSKDVELKKLRSIIQREEKSKMIWSNLSNEQREVIDCLVYGIHGTQYSENIRKFCLRQHYHSFAAYQSLRNFFNNHLPAKRTMQMWYSSIDGSPGIWNSAIDIIRERAESYLEEKKHPLHLCVMSDDMAICKKLSWNIRSEAFDGFATATSSSKSTSERKVAKEVFVIMAVGPDFKIPVAYHFINGLDTVDRAGIILEVIRRIENIGAIVISLTGDGHNVNIATADILGADCSGHQPYFYSPTNPERKIYFILDPPHMLKLIRKHFSKNKLYHQGQLVDWNLLQVLVNKQSKENLNLCNKLSPLHINWYQKPMNVKLAAETISRSNANVLEQLKIDGYVEFENCEPTVQFLRTFNDAFDIQNFAEKNQANNEYKQPICKDSAHNIFSFSERFKQYVEQIDVEVVTVRRAQRKPILKSTDGRGFLGFYNNFISIEGIYNDFVNNGPLETFYPFQFSQDHLESLFSLVRNCQGRNDNPNTTEFCSALRKLLVCHPLVTSVGHNVISNATGILTVSSKKPTGISPLDSPQTQEYEIECRYAESLEDELNDMEPYDHHMVAYIALCIEEKVIQKMNNAKHKLKCSDCINLLLSQHEKINDGLLALKATNTQPSKNTVNLVIFANAVLRLISERRSQGNDFNAVCNTIYNNVDIDNLYSNESFEEHEHELVQRYGHKEEFVMQLIRTYITLKSRRIGNKITDEERGELIRNRRRKDIHNAGQ